MLLACWLVGRQIERRGRLVPVTRPLMVDAYEPELHFYICGQRGQLSHSTVKHAVGGFRSLLGQAGQVTVDPDQRDRILSRGFEEQCNAIPWCQRRRRRMEDSMSRLDQAAEAGGLEGYKVLRK